MHCYNKSLYTKRQAQEVLKRLVSSGRWSHKTPGRIYECVHCNAWHITHEMDRAGGKEYPAVLKFTSRWVELMNK